MEVQTINQSQLSIDFKVTPVFEKNFNIKTRLVVNQGGSRSSKTYSLAQLLITKGLQEENKVFTIVRKTLPALKATAMRDFIEILQDLGIYSENNHNKTDNYYRIGSNLFEFIAVDEPQKIRGRKRHYLWINEANELKYEDYKQLALRTSEQIFLDYNPSDEFHWIYDHILTRDDCTFIKSTYKDNPFLEESLKKEIEGYKDIDENYWKIYGLGERGVSEATIYSHWQLIDAIPENIDDTVYGLDFGYNHATCLTEIGVKEKDIYTDEKIYETHLTNSQLIAKMDELGISKKKVIYADAQEPQRIEEIRQAGYNCVKANKSVNDGIITIKTGRWFITKRSLNTIKEVKSYKWKTKDELILDEPVKLNDHAMDSIRYGKHSYFKQPFIGFV